MTPRSSCAGPLSRRDFLTRTSVTASLAVAGLGVMGMTPSAARRMALPTSASDRVTLGRTGITCSVVGMGTGSVGVGQASNQTRLGVAGFTKVARHALDRGLNLFDVADQYGSHTYLRAALKGVPRESYVVQTKTHATTYANAKSHVERYLMELGVDYLDTLLLHCMTKESWIADHEGARDYLSEAKEKGLIRAHGVSCHGIDPLRVAERDPWVEVDLARINPEGQIMDADVPTVVSELEVMHHAGKGVIGMKILAEGRIKDAAAKDASLKFVLGLGTVNAFVVGFESTEQIDDLVGRVDRILTELKGA